MLEFGFLTLTFAKKKFSNWERVRKFSRSELVNTCATTSLKSSIVQIILVYYEYDHCMHDKQHITNI